MRAAEVVAVLGGGSERHRFVFPGRSGNRMQPQMSKDGKRIAAPAGIGGGVDLFEFPSGKHLHNFPWPGRKVTYVAFSPDGGALAALVDRPSALRIWDLKTFELLSTTPAKASADECRYVAYSPDGKLLVVGVAYPTNLSCVYDASTLEEIKSLPGGPHSRFSPDGKLLAICQQHETEVTLWNTETWELVKTLTRKPGEWGSVRFSPDGKVLAAGGEKHIQFWTTDTFEPKGDFDVPCCMFDFLADGKTFLARRAAGMWPAHGYGRWDATTGKPVGQFQVEGPKDVLEDSFSPDHRHLLIVLYDRLSYLRIFDPETGAERFAPTKHDGKVLAVAVSPGGEVVASSGAGADTRIRLWDLATGQLLRTLQSQPHAQGTLAFSPDGQTLASGSEKGVITFWDWQAGKQADSLPGLVWPVAQLAYSPDGKLLAFRTATGETKLYDLAAKKLRLIDPGGFAGGGCVAFSPDGKTLATGGSDLVLRLYDVQTGTERAVLGGHEGAIRWAAFRPDGTSVVFCGGANDRLIRHWELAPQAEKLALRGHTSEVLACVWRADGKLLVSAGTQNGMVRLWDPDARPPLSRAVRWRPNQGPISSMALTPEGRHLVLGHADGTLWVLRLAKVDEVLSVP